MCLFVKVQGPKIFLEREFMVTTSLSYVFKGGQFGENIKEIRGQMVVVCGKNCESGVTILEGGTHWG